MYYKSFFFFYIMMYSKRIFYSKYWVVPTAYLLSLCLHILLVIYYCNCIHQIPTFIFYSMIHIFTCQLFSNGLLRVMSVLTEVA